MKSKAIITTKKNTETIVHFSEQIQLNRTTLVTVPTDYYGIVIINGVPTARIETCNNVSLLKYLGRTFNGKNIQIAFIKKNGSLSFLWGFGGTLVKNEKEQNSYSIGAHGKYQLKIIDGAKLIKAFGIEQDINADILEKTTKPTIKEYGKPLLSKMLLDVKPSAYEINMLVPSFKSAMINEMRNNHSFADLGLELYSFDVVDGFHVDEQDLERIKNNQFDKDDLRIRLNEMENQMTDLIGSNDDAEVKKELHELKDIIQKMKDNQENDPVIEQVDELRTEIEKLKEKDGSEYFKKALDESLRNIEEKMNSKIDFIKEILENHLDENKQEQYPLYDQAKEEWLNQLKLTTDIQLSKAETDDDFAGVAGMVYSNVEDNLINKYHIPHKNKNFYMSLEDFEDAKKTLFIDDQPIYRGKYQPKYLQYMDMSGEHVEMPPEIRFMKTGLCLSTAVEAAKYWTALNRFRHRSEENTESLKNTVHQLKLTKKEYLKQIIDFFRKYGLYTRD